LRSRFSLNEQLDIVAMRANDRLAQPQFPGLRIREIPRKIIAIPRRELELRISSTPLICRCASAARGRQALDQTRGCCRASSRSRPAERS
jgi:hypothetical protein